MPERERYSHLFEGNPFGHVDPREAFSLLQWGNQARHSYAIEAPEPLVMLGVTKLLILRDRHLTFRNGEAFLAVGHKSNTLYIVPRVRNEPIKVIPKFSTRTARRIGQVLQTDYLSSKGQPRREHYYYHKHQAPFPSLWAHPSGVSYIRPAKHNGKPSYAVGREGIVG